MKKIIVILFLVCIAISIWLYLKKSSGSSTPPTVTATETNQALSQLPESNSIVATTNSINLASVPVVVEPTNETVNALTATNLEQWKTMIPGLRKSPGFKISEYWDMEQTNRLTGVPVLFEKGGQTISYKVRFIDISVKNGTDIIEVEMHSPIMNIDETRELGLQLCNILGVDSKGFTDWCDKVGNHWLDAPLYATGKGNYGFQMLNTFDNERPWYINFIIRNP